MAHTAGSTSARKAGLWDGYCDPKSPKLNLSAAWTGLRDQLCAQQQLDVFFCGLQTAQFFTFLHLKKTKTNQIKLN
jgi:hypothetical protein